MGSTMRKDAMTKPVYYDPQAYMKLPKHRGMTYTEVKAERRRRRRVIARRVMLAVWVAALLMAGYYVGR